MPKESGDGPSALNGAPTNPSGGAGGSGASTMNLSPPSAAPLSEEEEDSIKITSSLLRSISDRLDSDEFKDGVMTGHATPHPLRGRALAAFSLAPLT